MKAKKSLIFLVFLFTFAAVGTHSYAADTGWMTKTQMDQFVRKNLSKGKGRYPTRIACRPGQFKMAYKKITGTKPFHKWNWVHGDADKIDNLVARLRRSDRLDLKYRIVSRGQYKTASGKQKGCALAYR